jgi:putative Mg2+ transporter-C (MgtC) family protein
MEFEIMFWRLLFSFILALLFGIERQRSHKPVGLGTFVFVTIGSCGLTLIAISMGYEDPIPLLAAIVTGIGFLGAGALIKTSDKIFGFTTAASLWLFAVIGLIIGVGYYKVSLLLYIFIWISVFIDKYIEKKKTYTYLKKVNFKINKLNWDKEVMDLFKKFNIKRHKLLSKEINRKTKTTSLTYLLEGSGKNIRNFFENIETNPDFIEFSLE